MSYINLKNGQILHITRITKNDKTGEEIKKSFKYLVYDQDKKNPEILDIFDVETQTTKKYYFFFATELEYIDYVEKHGYSVPYHYDVGDNENKISSYIIEII